MGWTRRGALAAGLAAVSGCAGSIGSPRCPPVVDHSGAVRIGFGGDAMLGRSVADRWTDGDPTGVWGRLLDRLRALDGFVCNLECCISDRGRRFPNKTYYFRSPPDVAVPALEAAGTAAVSLANNHVLDFGETGLADTVSHLAKAEIAHTGAGHDRDAALDPAVSDAGGLTVATLGFTDQFSAYAAGPESPGTAYATLDHEAVTTRWLVREALDRARSSDPDLVVASLHWGPNWVVTPDATQRAFARWLIDEGVDVVHGHSAHVLQGIESYRGRPILYDTADIVDDYVVKPGLHNDRSALFELVVEDGTLAGVRAVPIVIANEAVDPAGERAAAWVRDRLRLLSGAFGTTVERDGAGLWFPLDSC